AQAISSDAPSEQPAPVEVETPHVEEFPWHDPALAMEDRMKLAEGRPHERRLMAAMAQLDCGACGYLCKTYAEAIASGEERDLTRCTPGGRETARMLKQLCASAPATKSEKIIHVSEVGIKRAGSSGDTSLAWD